MEQGRRVTPFLVQFKYQTRPDGLLLRGGALCCIYSVVCILSTKYHSKVKRYNIDDHNVPTLEQLLSFVKDVEGKVYKILKL